MTSPDQAAAEVQEYLFANNCPDNFRDAQCFRKSELGKKVLPEFIGRVHRDCKECGRDDKKQRITAGLNEFYQKVNW